MELLDGMLENGDLNGFVSNIIDWYNEEQKEKTLWEYWLHKNWQQSWPEFLESRNDKTQAAPTQAETLDILKESMNMMNSFCPVSGGVENGAIQAAGRDCDRCIEGEENP